jgi:hypothetical protein
MAQNITAVSTSESASVGTATLQRIWVLRLVAGLGIVLGGAISLVGTSWDIQWHSFVGRDRTLIPPHQMMLAGIALAGLFAITTVFLETFWVRRHPHLAAHTTSFAGLFSGPIGAYVGGFAALNAAIAFPLDSYWHALYGIDVAIWAPFHVMILLGMGLMPLGGAYLLQSSARLAATSGSHRAARLGHIFTVVALGTMMGILTLLISEATDDENIISIGNVLYLCFYPLVAGAMTAFVLSAAKFALPSRRTATYVVLCYLAFALLFAVFVPPATNLLVGMEGLQYRNKMATISYLTVVSLSAWPLLPILVAPLLDFAFGRARRTGWSRNRLMVTMALVSLLAACPVLVLHPVVGVQIAKELGLFSTIVSLLIGLMGIYLGTLAGSSVGETLRQEGK